MSGGSTDGLQNPFQAFGPSYPKPADTPPKHQAHDQNPAQAPPGSHPPPAVKPVQKFNPQDLRRNQPPLAKGSYGVVYIGTAPGFSKNVVIKDMQILSQKSVDEWKREVKVMEANKCPFIAEVYGYASTPTQLTIVMEYFPKGDLYGLLHKHPERHPLSMLQRLRMGRHIALGLAFLHGKSFMHRDVKSMNILVADDYACKLTDFGCAKLVNQANYLNTVNSGTPLWMAPEVKRGQYSFPADVYSLGLVLFELFERKLPYFDQLQQRVILPHEFQSASVVKPMINPDPSKRPTAQHTITVLDQMVNSIVDTLRKHFSEHETQQLKKDAGTSDDTQESIDKELAFLYRRLLTQPPDEVDAKINKYFKVSTPPPAHSAQHQVPPGYPPTGAPHGYPMPAMQQGYPVGMPMGYPPMPQGYPMIPGFPQPYGTPPGIGQGWPPGYSPSPM